MNQKQLKYLEKNRHVQSYRQSTIMHCRLLPFDNKTLTHEFWNLKNDWLANVKYTNIDMKFGAEMHITQSILKLQKLLFNTNEKPISLEEFEQLCIGLDIEKNVLNTIDNLRIPVRAKMLSKLAKVVVAFMKVLCYDMQLTATSIKFINFSVPS